MINKLLNSNMKRKSNPIIFYLPLIVILSLSCKGNHSVDIKKDDPEIKNTIATFLKNIKMIVLIRQLAISLKAIRMWLPINSMT